MSNCGLSSFAFFMALSLMTLLSRSQRAPSTSAVVKSRANPGMSLSSSNKLVAAVTLGGEQISDTIALTARDRSLLYLYWSPPSARITLGISPFTVDILSLASLVIALIKSLRPQ